LIKKRIEDIYVGYYDKIINLWCENIPRWTKNDKVVIPSEVEERQKIGILDAFFYDEPLWKRNTDSCV